MRDRYTIVSKCFHLFSLIQTAVGARLAGGREPNDAVAQVARGKSSDPVSDDSWWHYGNARSTKADIMTSIWGEGLVREIPAVDGAQVILAWPMILQSRTWDAGFLGPHLEAMPADAVLDGVLSQAECDTWFERLGLVAADAPRKWWRVW